MASVNEIGVIMNERRLNRSRHFSGEIARMEGTRSPRNEAVKLVSILSAVATQSGHKPPGKVSPSRSDYEDDCSPLERQIKSIERVVYIGHALLLPGGRFWRPRIRRERGAEYACERRVDGRIGGRGYSVGLVRQFPLLRFRNVPIFSYSGHFRGRDDVPNQSASRPVFGLINVRAVDCLGVRSIDGLQASRKNLAVHGQGLPHPTAEKFLSTINSRLSQQIQFGETYYVDI